MRSREILAVLAVAALWGGSPARGELVDRIVAIIDRDVVTLSEAEQARAVAGTRSGEDVPLVAIVERLIEARLVEREVERFAGEPVPPELVDEAVQDVRSSFESEEELQEMLAAAGITREELRSQLERQLAVARYLERRFRALSFVTEEQVRAYYRDELSSRRPEDEPLPELSGVSASIRRLLEERAFNQRVDQWIDGLKSRSHIRRYVW